MQIEDIGFFLGTKEYGENSFIVFVLSKKHGLVKSFSKYSRKELQSLMILDQINFIWKAKQKEGLGFIKINHKLLLIICFLLVCLKKINENLYLKCFYDLLHRC